MVVAIHQPQYLPWVPYFDKADQADVFVYLDDVQFQKGGVQNRNQIQTAQGPRWLSVPLRASLGLMIHQTPVADQQWQKKHVRTIEQEYRRAPFFSWFGEGLRSLLEREWTFLAELNIAVTEWMMERFAIRSRRVRSSELGVAGTADDRVIAICRALGATEYLSGGGARAYQDPQKFAAHGIALRYQDYCSQPYPQCHSAAALTPDLSALDLLLNTGPEAREILLAGRSARV
jgi:hypothetical protein